MIQPIKCFLLVPVTDPATGEQAVHRTATGNASNVVRPLFRRADGSGEPVTWHDAPPGAMIQAPWYDEWKGPDGKCYAVKVPRNADGSGVSDWTIDGPSSTHPPGEAWRRTGEAPALTVFPSILLRDGFHGWLKGGVLYDADDPAGTVNEADVTRPATDPGPDGLGRFDAARPGAGKPFDPEPEDTGDAR